MFKRTKAMMTTAVLTVSLLTPQLVLAQALTPGTQPSVASPTAAAVTAAKILSVQASADVVGVGGSVTYDVTVTPSTNYVMIEYDGKYERANAGQADASGNKVFSATISPAATQTVFLYASAVDSIIGAGFWSKRITVDAAASAAPGAASANGVAMTKVEADKEEVYEGDTITYTIETNDKANNVWVKMTLSGEARYVLATLASEADGIKVWNVTLLPDEAQTVLINANTAYSTFGVVTEEHSFTLTDPPARINSITANRSSVSAGSSLTLTVRTSVQAAYVWTEVDGARVNFKESGSNNTGGTRSWTASVSPGKTQTLTIYANATDSASGAMEDTFDVTVSSERVSITSAKAELNSSDDLTITVETNTSAAYVWAELDDDTVNLTTRSSSSSNRKTWTATYNLPNNFNDEDIVIYAGVTNGSRDTSRRIDIDDIGGDGEIFDFEARYDEYDIGDTVEFEVETDSGVDSVSLYEYGSRVDETDDYTTSNGRRIWKLSVRLYDDLDDNSITYTVRAYDGDEDETDRDSFTIDVYY